VRRRIEYKLAATKLEYKTFLAARPSFGTEEAIDAFLSERNLVIPVWSAADIGADEAKLGLAGSPTQVYKINFVVLEGTDSKEIPPTVAGIKALVQELVQEYIVG
jgi:hypothetical protein